MSEVKAGKTPFAVAPDGTPYLDAECSGIHPIVQQIDGMALTYFGEDPTPYLKVQDVIDWHRKEIKASYHFTGNPRIIRYLETALEKFRTGKVDWE